MKHVATHGLKILEETHSPLGYIVSPFQIQSHFGIRILKGWHGQVEDPS
jgi:hypothetical protein